MRQSLAICSWSLQPDSPTDLVRKVRACESAAVQLALDPLRAGASWAETETASILKAAGIQIVSGMMTTRGEDYSTLATIRETGGLRPDHYWDENLHAAECNAGIAARLGLDLVTLHAGFLPHDSDDPEYATIIGRVKSIADVFAAHGIRLGLETGQETAEALRSALSDIDHPSVGVNFDPANMILYGMGDPVQALADLAPQVVQIHIKDAIPSPLPSEWGSEVPAGSGAVDWASFFGVVRDRLPHVGFAIEREAGDARVEDIRAAAAMIAEHMENPDE